MRKMKDSGIEWIKNIPNDWKLERLQWHLEEVNNSNNPIQTKQVLSLTNKLGVIPYEEKGNLGNKSKENIYEYKLAYPNTIVANSMNILIGSVGLCNYFGCVSPVYFVFQTKKGNNIHFLNYIFQIVGFQRELRKFANGILEIRLRVSASDILKRLVPFPSGKEQQRISDFLDKRCDKIDSIIFDIEKQLTLLETIKRSLISECVMKGLSKDAETKASRIYYMAPYNKNWEISKIRYECRKLNRSFNISDTALICSNKGKIIIRPDDMTGKMVSDDNAMQGIKEGDIAIHGMDTWHGAIAISNFNGKITRVVHVCDSKQDKRYIVYYLQHLSFTNVYKLISNGVRGNTSDFRSWDKIADIYIPIPSIKEQRAIADYLDKKCTEIDSIIADKKRQLDVLENYKKSIIYEYVTGKKEVI